MNLSVILLTSVISLTMNWYQTDWRRMRRIDVVNKVSNTTLTNGLNKIDDSAGFTLYAKAKDGKILSWRAESTKRKSLKISAHDYEVVEVGSSKETTNKKVIVICVDEKEVCYDVQKINK